MNEELKQLLDITGPVIVQIQIRNDGDVIWINVDGMCRMRICRISALYLDDDRNCKHQPVN